MAVRSERGIGQRIFGTLNMLAAGARLAAFRFPLAVLAIAATAVLLNLAVADIYLPDEPSFFWTIAALYGAAASSVVVVVAGEARGVATTRRQVLSLAAGVAVGSAIWFGSRAGVHAPALIAAATFAIPLAPYTGRGGSTRFWVFGFWTAVGLVLAFLSVLLFVAGLSAILEMVRYLFAIGLSAEAYGHIFTTAFAFVGPLFALGRIPRDFNDDEPLGGDLRLVSGVRILFDWIAVPLALVTAVVLHLYAGKIGASGEMPSSEIGWIVTFFALLVLSLRIAIDPFVAAASGPTRFFARFFALLLIVPLMLLAAAASIRIASEGFTLERYFLALGAAAASLVVVLQLPRATRGDLRIMAAVPVLLLALASFGPWGAPAVVGRSQTERFLEEIGGAAIIDPANIAGKARSPETARRLVSRLRALEDAGELVRLYPHLQAPLREEFAQARREGGAAAVDLLVSRLGLRNVSTPKPLLSFTAGANAVLDLTDFDRAFVGSVVAENGGGDSSPAADAPAGEEPEVRLVDGALRLRIAGETGRFDLESAIANLPPETFATDPEVLSPPVFDISDAEGRTIRVMVTQVVRSEEGGRILSLTLSIFWRSGDWPD